MFSLLLMLCGLVFLCCVCGIQVCCSYGLSALLSSLLLGSPAVLVGMCQAACSRGNKDGVENKILAGGRENQK